MEAIYLYSDLLNIFGKERYEVDHIIPLHHWHVCGLHNEFNLQVITADENAKKSNNFQRGVQIYEKPIIDVSKIEPKILKFQQVLKHFSNLENCYKFVLQVRWQDGLRCVKCNSAGGSLVGQNWQCSQCSKKFNILAYTRWSRLQIGLDKWLVAFWLLGLSKGGAFSVKAMWNKQDAFFSKLKKALKKM